MRMLISGSGNLLDITVPILMSLWLLLPRRLPGYKYLLQLLLTIGSGWAYGTLSARWSLSPIVLYLSIAAVNLLVLCFHENDKLFLADQLLVGYALYFIADFVHFYAILKPAQDAYLYFYHRVWYFVLLYPVRLLVLLVFLLSFRWLLWQRLQLRTVTVPPLLRRAVTVASLLWLLCFSLILQYTGTTFGLGLGLSAFYLVVVVLLYQLAVRLAREQDLRLRENTYHNLQQYTAELEELYRRLRGERHDYRNTLATLYGFIEDQDLPGLTRYFKQKLLTAPEPSGSEQELAELAKLQIPELKGVILDKLYRAAQLQMQVGIEISGTLRALPVEALELARLLGIYLDNALEAAAETPEKRLSLTMLDLDGEIDITVGNTCQAEHIPLGALADYGYSTKGAGRGLGLYRAAKLLAKYPMMEHEVSCRNHYFLQTLKIKVVQ